MILPAELDLEIPKGGDFSQPIAFEDGDGEAWDMTGCTLKAQIRERKTRDSALIAEITITQDDPSTGEMLLDVAESVIDLITVRNAYWDLRITHPDGKRYYYAEGRVAFPEQVTE